MDYRVCDLWGLMPESIEWFIEDQALSPSYDIGSSPPVFSKLSFFLSLHVCRRSSLLTGGGDGGGAKSDYGKKAWPSINHLVLYSIRLYGMCFLLFQKLLDGEHARSKAPQHSFRYRSPLYSFLLPMSQLESLSGRVRFRLWYHCTLAVTRAHLQLGGSLYFPSVVSVGNFEAMYISWRFFHRTWDWVSAIQFHNSKK
jgi:hypothetical protein